MEEAFNAKRAQYDMKRRLNEKSRESIIDLTEADRMQRLHDMQREELRRNRPNATDTLMESTTVNRETTPFIAVVDERKIKGLDNEPQDGYDKYNPEPMEDAILEAQGATIKYSAVTIGNDTYVKEPRKQPIRGLF